MGFFNVFVARVVCPFVVLPPYTNKKNNKENDLSLLLLARPPPITRKINK